MAKGKPFKVILVAIITLIVSLLILTSACGSKDEPVVSGGGLNFSDTVSGVVPVYGQQQDGLSVTGTGKVTVTPDIALVNLGVESQESTVSAAQEKAGQAMASIMTSLTDNGIADKDIKTVQFSISPVYEYDPYVGSYSRTQTIKGYKVRNMVNVTIRDTAKTGAIIDAAAAAAGDLVRVDNISFTVEDHASLYDLARDLAVKDAMSKAQKTAGLAGIKLGSVVNISENSNYYYPAVAPVALSASSFVETPISSGVLEITLSVQMVYSIE